MAAILESLTFPADLFPGDDVLTSELATLTGPAEPLVAPIAPWNVGRTLPAEHPAVAAARPELRLVHSATIVEPDARAVRPRPVAVPTPAPIIAAAPRSGASARVRGGVRALVGGLALAGLVALAALGVLALTGADAAASSPASSTTRAPSVAVDVAAASTPTDVVVRQGDTVWSIARRLHPSGDVRALVDQLTRRAGGTALVVGQRIDVRGLLD